MNSLNFAVDQFHKPLFVEAEKRIIGCYTLVHLKG